MRGRVGEGGEGGPRDMKRQGGHLKREELMGKQCAEETECHFIDNRLCICACGVKQLCTQQ